MSCDINLHAEQKVNNKWERLETNGPLYPNQNYELFAILANVRNAHNITPIALPKGLPKDVSDEIHRYFEKDKLKPPYGMSWLTLKELLEFNWDKTISIRAWVDEKDAQAYRANGTIPLSFSREFASGPDVELIEWKESYFDVADDFWHFVMPFLKSVANDDRTDEVRIVFWFMG